MIYSWREFNYDILKSAKTIPHKGKKQKVATIAVCSAFDIETTSLKEHKLSFMYSWQWAFGADCYIGRTWNEFRTFTSKIMQALDGKKLVVYVHNLSFEFQYIKSIFHFDSKDIFALSTRRVAKATYNTLEFRCSYILTNMSLAEFTDRMDVPHKKLNDFKYTNIRYPWTELTNREIEYISNDVIGLVEALQVYMMTENDDLITIPMTSTGYVRRDVKNAMQAAGTKTQHLTPSFELYTLLREAFRGGNTHANRWYAGKEIENVRSFDRSSSYPDVLVNCAFPITPFRKVKTDLFPDGKAWVARVKLDNIKLKGDHIPIPYISYSKCLSITKNDSVEWLDNGRILEAESITISITDIDYKIISNQYDFDTPKIIECWTSTYGTLPFSITDTTLYYYHKKTSLKGVSGEELFYLKSKNKLNSIYGMMAQNPGKLSIELIDNMLQIPESATLEEAYTKYYGRSFTLPYQWGVWTTAHARFELQEGIDLAGEDCLYTDTDSVKFVGDHDFSKLNEKYFARSKKNNAFADDPKGKRHYMGVYEEESGYDTFKTWGAKKYAYIQNGELHATIAGVATPSKYKPDAYYGAKELSEAGGIDAFEPGFVFTKSAGNTVIYNEVDKPYMLQVDGGEVEITSNIYFEESTYTVSLSKDYSELLLDIMLSWT